MLDSLLCCLLLLLPHRSSGASTSTQFRSPLHLLSRLESGRFRLARRTIALSCLHSIHEILLELLGYPVVCVEVVIRMLYVWFVIYVDWFTSA
jgi:hypothetical protein